MDTCISCPAYQDINLAAEEFRAEHRRGPSKPELYKFMFKKTKCPGGESLIRGGQCPRKIDLEQMQTLASQALIKTPILKFTGSLSLGSGIGLFSSSWNLKALKRGEGGQSIMEADYKIGNVYNGGGICWGRLSNKTPKDGMSAVSMFFSSPFNGDMTGGPTVKQYMERYEVSIGWTKDELMSVAYPDPTEMKVTSGQWLDWATSRTIQGEWMKVGKCSAIAILGTEQFLDLAPADAIFTVGMSGIRYAIAKVRRSTDRKAVILDFGCGALHLAKTTKTLSLSAKTSVISFKEP